MVRINNMEETMKSLISTIVGVVIGAILTHFTNWIEDNRLENKKTRRKIYYKIFPELQYFFLNDNVSEKIVYSESKVKELKDRIESILEDNIDYLDKRLFSVYYYNLKYDKYYQSLGYSIFVNINHLETFEKMLSFMQCTFKKPNMIDKKLLFDVEELKYCYKIWFLLMEKFQNWTFVDYILQGKSLYRRTFKEICQNKQTQKLFSYKYIDDNKFYDIFTRYCFGEIELTRKTIKNIAREHCDIRANADGIRHFLRFLKMFFGKEPGES